MKLSIIIPVFNEEKTIFKVLERVEQVVFKNWTKDIIVVNDGSTDRTKKEIERYVKKRPTYIRVINHEKNKGKGAAVGTGILVAKGDYIIIQDADLEYNPMDIQNLLSVVNPEKKNVVYGSRLNRLPHLHQEEHRPQFLLHYFGNRLLSFITSILYGQWVTDMETCYKLFPRSAVKDFIIRARGFEFEPEITSKLLKKGYTIQEVSITATPRGYEEGKKLNTVRDGMKALWAILKYRFID